jgi:hypothetical protein
VSAALAWTKFIVETVFRLLAFGLTTVQLVFFYKVFRWWAYERPAISRGGTASPRVLFRRLWCTHRHVYRSRDPYGKQSTFCLRCNVDVNAGKPREEWR